ncbi:MAG: MerR family transcriptional regulator [Deltaproteobacteria bacterium]|nr:MerR family transcriptional regulator [Deltaproteobacteria bacterium]
MYRIRRAAELAGVTPELLRAWERRYGLVAPVRTDAGYRVYSDDDVRVLKGAKRLVEGGQSIAEVAQRPREEIVAAAAGLPRSEVPLADIQPAAATVDPFNLSPAIEEAVTAISLFDQDRLEGALFRVMALGILPADEVCESFLLPLLKSIGDEWEAGRLSIAAEHFGSSIIRTKILRLIEHERAKAGAPVVVCACPAGEEHEGALLAFAVSASRSGMRVVYLGADTPADDIVRAAERTRATMVALSITRELTDPDVRVLVSALEPWRIGAPGRQVLIGGRGAEHCRSALEAAGLRVADRPSTALRTLSPENPQ